MTHVCVSFYKWTMRSVLKQDNRSGILILGRVKGEDEERHVLQSSRGDSVLTKRIIRCEEEQDKVNTADSAFIFLIIQSQSQWSGWSGRR